MDAGSTICSCGSTTLATSCATSAHGQDTRRLCAPARDHGVWYKLDHLLKENEVPTKTSNGLKAIEWWQEGERALLQSTAKRCVPPKL